MLLTFLFRICAFVGICTLKDDPVVHPELQKLNSFSSKTAYRNVDLPPLKTYHNSLKQCSLVQSNAIYRHGTRFPSVSDIEKVKVVHRKIMKSNAKFMLPTAFQNWFPVFQSHKAKELATVGYEEMMMLGNRMANKLYKKIENFDPKKHVKVVSSSSSRSKLSASAFYRSILNNTKTIKEVSKLIIENDKALRFFDNCPAYVNSVLNNKAYKKEYKRFLNGVEMKKVIKEIQQKWRLTDISLSSDDVRVLYVMCGYEIATNLSSFMFNQGCGVSPGGDGLNVCSCNKNFSPVESSPLCTLFEDHHYNILEYLYDLKHYWLKSYGADINWMQSCGLMSPVIEEMVRAARFYRQSSAKSLFTAKKSKFSNKGCNFGSRLFDDRIKDWFYKSNREADYTRGMFWFGHAETLLPVLSLLGLFNQTEPMSASHYSVRKNLLSDMKRRFQFYRVSGIAPFSGNIDLELWHCPQLVDMTKTFSGFRVRALINERTVFWPAAAEQTYRAGIVRESTKTLVNFPDHMPLEAFLRLTNLCLPDKYSHDSICVKGLTHQEITKATRRSDEL